MQFLYFLIPCPEAHKSFHLDFEFLQLFGYFSFLVVSFFDTFESFFYSANFDNLHLALNLSCYSGFRCQFWLGFFRARENGKSFLNPGLSRLNTWRLPCPFILSFSVQLWSWWFFNRVFFTPQNVGLFHCITSFVFIGTTFLGMYVFSKIPLTLPRFWMVSIQERFVIIISWHKLDTLFLIQIIIEMYFSTQIYQN